MVTICDFSDFIPKSTMLLHHNLNAGTTKDKKKTELNQALKVGLQCQMLSFKISDFIILAPDPLIK